MRGRTALAKSNAARASSSASGRRPISFVSRLTPTPAARPLPARRAKPFRRKTASRLRAVSRHRASDRRHTAVADVHQLAEIGRGQHLLDKTHERAQRHFEIDVLSVPRLERSGDRDGQRRARPDAAERAEAFRVRVSRTMPAQKVVDEADIGPRALRNDQPLLDRVRFSQNGPHMIEQLDPKIRQHRQRMNGLGLLAMPQHFLAGDRPICLVREAVRLQRRNQRHLMPRAPLRMRAHEIEGIGAGSARDDGSQELVAMTLRFLGEFVIDGIAVFGALLLQELERALPNLVASFLETRNDTGRQRVRAETLVPLASAHRPSGWAWIVKLHNKAEEAIWTVAS